MGVGGLFGIGWGLVGGWYRVEVSGWYRVGVGGCLG